MAFDRLVGVEDRECLASFEAFAREHARSLFGTAYVLCHDVGSAEELVQDTLVASLAGWERVRRARSPVAYVRRSLVHRFVDTHRGPSGRTVPMIEVPERTPVRDIADQAVAREAVRALLATLSARPRAALVLKYLYDWPDEAVAEAIGCRVATVRSMTRRALRTLRESTLYDVEGDPAAAEAARPDPIARRREVP